MKQEKTFIQKLADWLFSESWQQCAARYEYAAKTYGIIK